jgi:hypothetical protein
MNSLKRKTAGKKNPLKKIRNQGRIPKREKRGKELREE